MSLIFSAFFSIPPLFTHGYKSPGGSDPIIDVVGRGEEWGLEWFGLYWTDSLWSHWEEELGHLKDYWQVCLRKVILKYGKAGIFVEVWIILYRSSAWFHPTSFIHRLQFCHLKNTIKERAHVQSMSNHLSFTSLCQTTFAGSAAEEICRWTFFLFKCRNSNKWNVPVYQGQIPKQFHNLWKQIAQNKWWKQKTKIETQG